MIHASFDVRTIDRICQVVIGERLLQSAGRMLSPRANRVFVVTDRLVADLLLEPFLKTIDDGGVRSFAKKIDVGESAKSLQTACEVYKFLAKNAATRSDLLVALGGGIVGDLAGFVASTFKRGMRLVQVPTTLLSQVDSAIGGKTGVNLPDGKNLVGTFYQPHLVIVDISALETLPAEQFRNGLAEIIKYAVSLDTGLLDLILSSKEEILSKDPQVLAVIVERCLRIKAKIVKQDEREERKKREILNFGHTVGHAIESCSGYTLPHGLAVAIGIAEEARFAARLGLLDSDSLRVVLSTLSAFDLPVNTPASLDTSEIEAAVCQDKKMRNGRLMIPLLAGLGRAEMTAIDVGQLSISRRRDERC
jgi:3-dehydroquinate synthase